MIVVFPNSCINFRNVWSSFKTTLWSNYSHQLRNVSQTLHVWNLEKTVSLKCKNWRKMQFWSDEIQTGSAWDYHHLVKELFDWHTGTWTHILISLVLHVHFHVKHHSIFLKLIFLLTTVNLLSFEGFVFSKRSFASTKMGSVEQSPNN